MWLTSNKKSPQRLRAGTFILLKNNSAFAGISLIMNFRRKKFYCLKIYLQRLQSCCFFHRINNALISMIYLSHDMVYMIKTCVSTYISVKITYEPTVIYRNLFSPLYNVKFMIYPFFNNKILIFLYF